MRLSLSAFSVLLFFSFGCVLDLDGGYEEFSVPMEISDPLPAEFPLELKAPILSVDHRYVRAGHTREEIWLQTSFETARARDTRIEAWVMELGAKGWSSSTMADGSIDAEASNRKMTLRFIPNQGGVRLWWSREISDEGFYNLRGYP